MIARTLGVVPASIANVRHFTLKLSPRCAGGTMTLLAVMKRFDSKFPSAEIQGNKQTT